MKRAFIAIKIKPDEEFVKAYQILKNQLLNEDINWVNIENFHLTLKFLGNVHDENIKEIISELKKISTIPSFNFQIDGIHLFKDIQTPRVIYSGINAEKELFDLFEEVNNCLSNLELFHQEKGFTPHLTLGRIKSLKGKDNLKLILHDLRKIYFQQIECSEFILFESILNPTGPIYKPLEIFKLP